MSQQPLPPSDEVATAPDQPATLFTAPSDAAPADAITAAEPTAVDAASDAAADATAATSPSADSTDGAGADTGVAFSELLGVPAPEPGGLDRATRGKIFHRRRPGDRQPERPARRHPAHPGTARARQHAVATRRRSGFRHRPIRRPAGATHPGKKRGLLNLHKLRVAHEQKQAVTGTVRAVNKGGFEVRVHGARGFVRCRRSISVSRRNRRPISDRRTASAS
jgi:hypothetical protein